MRLLLNQILRRLIRIGTLSVTWPDGQTSQFSGQAGPQAAMRIVDDRTIRDLVLNPGLAFGEAYMDDRLIPVGCDIAALLELVVINLEQAHRPAIMGLQTLARRLLKRISQFNPAGRSRRNVAHHYDLNGQLYSLFLDQDRQYSCAYFRQGDETLEAAQDAKKRHIAAKLLLNRPDLSVLDIGCGWGGMAITLARDYGARVTGITLSSEQLSEARARAEAAGLTHRVTFEMMDYRAVRGRFDRVVSVGMFEHVGVPHYTKFFSTIRNCLADDGVALLHSIGHSGPPSATNPWLEKYIFPGGYSPSLSEVMPGIERSGLVVTDIEILRLHYAETLRHWRQRFTANRAAIAALYDERFCRMFEFYLIGCELAFRYQGEMVFQIQCTRQQTAVPLTRDYIAQAEQAP